MDTLVARTDIKGIPKDKLDELISWDLLASLVSGDDAFVSASQLENLRRLILLDDGNNCSNLLAGNLFNIGNIALIKSDADALNEHGGSILMQLLPYIFCKYTTNKADSSVHNKTIFDFYEYKYESLIATNKNIYTKFDSIKSEITKMNIRVAASREARSSVFARSASYMGSKKALSPFIFEIVNELFHSDGTILDLMCGSGAVSGCFARQWNTYSSDVQYFSRLLALVQGGGFTVQRAQNLINYLIEIAEDHYAELEKLYHEEVEFESSIIHSETTDKVVQAYADWVMSFQRIGKITDKFKIGSLIEERMARNKARPYMLFTAYYANLFFGIKQCIEIDSLRYAIDQIEDEFEREWTLGALICAVSSCADNHSGHFAQPRVKVGDANDIIAKLPKTLFKRSLSITQEFVVRLLSLSEESQNTNWKIQTIPGPWKTSLFNIGQQAKDSNLLVYIDPPYKREEYSRYYHILETLVLYNYPHVSGQALVPSKGTANRYASEFFTRLPKKATAIIVDMLGRCLTSGYDVLLSYANSGIASISDILAGIKGSTKSVDLFSSPAKHSSHGNRKAKMVTEYLLYVKSNKKP